VNVVYLKRDLTRPKEVASTLLGALGEKYEAGGARYLVVDVNYYGLTNNDVQKYLDAAHGRPRLGEGFAVGGREITRE
jgi:hypothetical protein